MPTVAVQVAGTGLLPIDSCCFSASLCYFWSRGGTPAAWDPPRRFVVDGPYRVVRVVRNPMISGVISNPALGRG